MPRKPVCLNISGAQTRSIEKTRSIPWLPRPWLLTSPSHQQLWHWLCEIGSSLSFIRKTLQWHYNERHGISNHQPLDCLLNASFRCRFKENIKAPHHWPLCREFTGDLWFPAQRASNAENVSISWRHHEFQWCYDYTIEMMENANRFLCFLKIIPL